MFELQIIRRYLVFSKKRQTNAFISSISIFTIALTVWLLIVFLSILKGVENNWIDKLTTLQAPIRIVPNQDFFEPEDLFSDEPEKPSPRSDLITTLHQLNLNYDAYSATGAILKIQLVREQNGRFFESTITQASYLTNPPAHSKKFFDILLPYEEADHQNLLKNFKKTVTPCQFIDGKLQFSETLNRFKPILLPKNFKDSGVLVGDQIEIELTPSYSLMGAAQSFETYVAGFYDPGLMSVGTRMAFLSEEEIELIASPHTSAALDPLLKGGFFIYLKDLQQIDSVVAQLKKETVAHFFDVIPYTEFPFVKEILQQFKTDQILFSLIGFVILLIACLNIIAALILIVQEKKQEIGLFVALGASKNQITRIFGALGFLIGFSGFLIGTCLAILTLLNLEKLVSHILILQGHPAIKALNFHNDASLISWRLIGLICLITPILAMLSGLIPARRALKIEPVEILKNG